MSHHVSAWLSELNVGLEQNDSIMIDADSPPHLNEILQHELMGWETDVIAGSRAVSPRVPRAWTARLTDT
eukprot:363164-Chlamydomonas_euryale.AAC.2